MIDIDSRVWMSFLIDAFSIPLCLLKLPVNNAKPEEAITSPPAMRSDSIEIPKKISRYLPIKNDKNKMTKALIAVKSEVLFFSFRLSSCVSETNIGTVPKGFITENTLAKTIRNNSIQRLIAFDN